MARAQNALGGTVGTPTSVLQGVRGRIDRQDVEGRPGESGVAASGRFIVYLETGADVKVGDLFVVVRPDGTSLRDLRVRSVYRAALLGPSHLEVEVEPVTPGRQ